jgi:hypothetical protein
MRFSLLAVIGLAGPEMLAARSASQQRTPSVPSGFQSVHRSQVTETVLYRFGSHQHDGVKTSTTRKMIFLTRTGLTFVKSIC